jgi:hypothetical protein
MAEVKEAARRLFAHPSEKSNSQERGFLEV